MRQAESAPFFLGNDHIVTSSLPRGNGEGWRGKGQQRAFKAKSYDIGHTPYYLGMLGLRALSGSLARVHALLREPWGLGSNPGMPWDMAVSLFISLDYFSLSFFFPFVSDTFSMYFFHFFFFFLPGGTMDVTWRYQHYVTSQWSLHRRSNLYPFLSVFLSTFQAFYERISMNINA